MLCAGWLAPPVRSQAATKPKPEYSLLLITVYGADAYNTPRDGGFAVRGPEETGKDIGTWVRLARNSLTIPARTRADIPFTVTIPETAAHIDGSDGDLLTRR